MLNKSQIENYLIPKDKMKKIINNALHSTIKNIHSGRNDGNDHYILSQNWVKYFALEIEDHYENMKKQHNIISFFNKRIMEDSPIKVKEFLFDITVARTKHVNNSSISFISNPIWQIESEFRQLISAIIADFQKLISGCAPYKMMVGPMSTRSKKDEKNKYLEITKELAIDVSGTLYFLFITHPRTWYDIYGKRTEYAGQWLLYKWEKSKWIPLS